MKKLIPLIISLCILLCIATHATQDTTYYTFENNNIEYAAFFSEGLCAARDKQTQRCGFIDKTGNWVIEPQYKSAEHFSDGICPVTTVDGEKILIDRSGNCIFKGAVSYQKRGDYGIICISEQPMYPPKQYVLVDKNYQPIFKEGVTVGAIGESLTFFEHKIKGGTYICNYKGEILNEKIHNLGFELNENYSANGNYLIIRDEENNRPVIIDINGNCISDFPKDTGLTLYFWGNYICPGGTNNIFDMTGKLILTADKEIEIKAYYNKYFVLSKRGGTSALYKADGTLLVDYGKWDSIVPSSIANRMLVEVNGKYGIADFNNIMELPFVEYRYAKVENDGKTVRFYNGDSKTPSTLLVDFLTLNQKTIPTIWIPDYNNSRILLQEGEKLSSTVMIIDERMNTLATKLLDRKDSKTFKDGVYFTKNETGGYIFYVFKDNGGIKIKLDNEFIAFDTAPIIQNGRTLVPLRAIFEAFGASVEWDGATQTITAKKQNTVITMQIGKNTMTKNGQEIALDVPPQIVGNRTLVPVRAIAESFDIIVDWNGYSSTVSLFSY